MKKLFHFNTKFKGKKIALIVSTLLVTSLLLVGLKQVAEAETNEDGVSKENRILVGSFLGNNQRRYYGFGEPTKLDRLNRLKLNCGYSYTYKGGFLCWRGQGWTGQSVAFIENGKPYLAIGSYDHYLRKIDLEKWINGASTEESVVCKYKYIDIIKGSPTVYYDAKNSRFVIMHGSRYGKQKGNGVHLGLKHIWSFRAIDSRNCKEVFRVNAEKTPSKSRDNDGSALYIPERNMIFNASENSIGYFLDPDKFDEIPHKHIKGEKTRGKKFYQPKIHARFKFWQKRDRRLHGGEIYPEGSPSQLGDWLWVASGSGHIYGIDMNQVDWNNPEKLQYPHWDLYVGMDTESTISISKDGKLFATLEKEFVKGDGGMMKINPKKQPKDSVDWYLPTRTVNGRLFAGGIVGSAAINDEYLSQEQVPLVATNSVEGKLYVVSQLTTEPGKKVYGPLKKYKYNTPRIVFKQRVGSSISTPIFAEGNKLITAAAGRVYLYQISYEPSNADDKKAVLSRNGNYYRVNIELLEKARVGGAIEATPIVYKGNIIIACRDTYLYVFGDKSKLKKNQQLEKKEQ